MGKKWSGSDEVTVITDLQVMGLAPDTGSTSGLKQVRIAIANFFSTLTSAILDNETDIIDHETRIDTLEEDYSRIALSRTATYETQQEAYSLITLFCFSTATGTPIVSVGTTLGGTDIVSSRGMENGYRNISVLAYTKISRTLYVTITGGTCLVTTFKKLGINDNN